MTAPMPVLKVLLKQRHMQGYRTFCKEYNRLARKLDADLVDRYPSKAQFYRWISGELIGVPYADHCRILEEMFPGWTVDQLFARHDEESDPVPSPTKRNEMRRDHFPIPSPSTIPIRARFADVTSIFVSRAEFMQEIPPRALFDGAREICMVGLSLNMICQQYSDKSLIAALEDGTEIKCLFLDPEGEHMKMREREESQPVGHLATLTRLNIEALRRVSCMVSPAAEGSLAIRIYDEPVRFNVIIVDERKCVAQPYLPDARGVESPTLVMEADEYTPGLFETFNQIFHSIWDRAREVG